MNIHRTEYASNAKGNTGVAIGSTALGVAALNAIAPGGVVDRFLGRGRGGCEDGGAMAATAAAIAANTASSAIIAEKDAKIAKLESELSTDSKISELKENLLRDWLKPLSDRSAEQIANEARMEEQIKCLSEKMALKEVIFQKELELAKQEAKCCCDKTNMRIDCLKDKVDAITKTVIPSTAVEKAA